MKSITELFKMEDCAKNLLLNSVTEKQEKAARSFLHKIREDIKIIYIPSEVEDV